VEISLLEAAIKKMSLQKSYPKEWEELINEKVPKEKIDEYLLKFVARLLKEIKENKRNEDDLGDGWSMVINRDKNYYTLNPDVYSFLFRLGDYGLQEIMGHGDSEYGEMLYSPIEVEIELIKVSRKLGIKLDL